MKKIFYYLNGKIVEKNKAVIPINDLGLLRAYGVFDYLKTYNRRPFHPEDHVNRFFRSASHFNLKMPVSKKELRRIILELIARNKSLKELSFRMVLTGGETEDAKTSKKPTFFIVVGEAHSYPESVFEKGIKLATLNYGREFPEIKTINYLFAVSQWKNILEKKASEILYVSEGKVLEASTSNFFMVKNKTLFTPKNNILGGVTRKLVIELARKNGIKVAEKEISLSEVLKADECFITATDKEITPVVKIDDKIISNGRVGPITKKLLGLFRDSVKSH
ncbi:MAG: aminotransferase class IV [Candidatus Paceibacterota bacterium]